MQDGTALRTLARLPNQWTGEGPVWCPVGTMRDVRPFGPGGNESRRGTQHFAPGARLYFCHVMSYSTRHGEEMPSIEVVGRHRATHRYVRMIVRASWVDQWRPDLVYSPQVIRMLQPMWDGTTASKLTAEEYVDLLAKFSTLADE